MFARRIPLLRIFGFQVWIDWSWFILALLISWSLAAVHFPARYPDAGWSPAMLWTMGVLGAAGLFTSIILHELGHALIARRFGMQMRGITLFVFGGVAEMTDEPPSARAELCMAIAGPIVSVAIGAAMVAAAIAGTSLGWPLPIVAVTGWLGWINLVLVVFNLVPAFPLDGGRVLRAALWHLKGDLRWATRLTSSIGGGFGVALMLLGALNVVGGNLVGGMWWLVLGLFLKGAATSSYQQLLVRRALEGEPVARFMSRTPIVVPGDITVRELIDAYFYRYYFKMYPVEHGGRLDGCVSIADVKAIPRDEWPARRVSEIAQPCSEENSVRPTDDAMQALGKLSRSGRSRLLVVDDGELVGVLSLKDLLKFLALRTELEEAA